MDSDTTPRLFYIDRSGNLRDRAAPSEPAWKELPPPPGAPAMTWTRLGRTIAVLFLSHLIPALAIWLSYVGIARTAGRVADELDERWRDYVRTDPTIHGALRE